MPDRRCRLLVGLLICVGFFAKPLPAQLAEMPKAPMRASVAARNHYPQTPSLTPQRVIRPPARVAQLDQPFSPNSPPSGFSSGPGPLSPGDLRNSPAIGPPNFGAAGPVSGGDFAQEGFREPNFGAGSTIPRLPQSPIGSQPWSPNRPPQSNLPYPSANGYGVGQSPVDPFSLGPSPTANDMAAFSRFGVPPQGFDPGFTSEVQVADLTVNVTPSAQAISYFAGLGFNSDQGVFGRLSYDDRDFDWSAFPWRNPPVPFRGGGQRLRLEAMPGAEMQRYLVSFEQPFFSWFGGRPVSFNLSGHYFERDYFDWNERRFGGRFGFGYGISDALALRTKFRVENVDVSDPRLPVPILQRSVGDHELYAGAVSLTYDTRDIPYAPSSGTYLDLGFEQVFGSFEYPRGTVDFRRYVTVAQRVDRTGRQIFGLTFNGSITGSDTPIYDRWFAGGYSTLRGFRFRHASPKVNSIIVGGELSLTGSAEYYLPVTADDMVRGLFFADIGTISEGTSIDSNDLRVSIGGGLRIYIPALGPAPLSIDAAVPLVRAETDRVQNIHFYVNLGF